MSKHLIGLFGGTFDPVHLGHINAVNELQQELEFSKIHWILSARPPHKNQVSASIPERFKMLELALADDPRFIPDDTEISRLEKSWTFDTVKEFKRKFPDHHPCLIIGGDSLQNLPTWYRYSELIELASFIVMARPGYEPQLDENLTRKLVSSAQEMRDNEGTSIMLFENTEYAISSTQIRSLIASEGVNASSLNDLLPSPVLEYIQTHKAYSK